LGSYAVYLQEKSSDTVSLFLPFALRADSTLRPDTVDILSLNPCLFLFFLFDGWNVLFMTGYLCIYMIFNYFMQTSYTKNVCKGNIFSDNRKLNRDFFGK
jgi:hypothetical protein